MLVALALTVILFNPKQNKDNNHVNTFSVGVNFTVEVSNVNLRTVNNSSYHLNISSHSDDTISSQSDISDNISENSSQ